MLICKITNTSYVYNYLFEVNIEGASKHGLVNITLRSYLLIPHCLFTC